MTLWWFEDKLTQTIQRKIRNMDQTLPDRPIIQTVIFIQIDSFRYNTHSFKFEET